MDPLIRQAIERVGGGFAWGRARWHGLRNATSISRRPRNYFTVRLRHGVSAA
jgi:hypothetical protein